VQAGAAVQDRGVGVGVHRRHGHAFDFTAYWVYIVGPILGAAIAVGFAFILRGRGGGLAGSAAAQGALFTAAEHPDQR
jgi:aquaporin Z